MAGKKINLTDQLKKYFGFDTFKGNQEAIIQNLLDVYKRQDNFLTYSHDGVHIMSIDESGHIILMRDVVYQFVNDEPVSYTHLDVYKRQER